MRVRVGQVLTNTLHVQLRYTKQQQLSKATGATTHALCNASSPYCYTEQASKRERQRGSVQNLVEGAGRADLPGRKAVDYYYVLQLRSGITETGLSALYYTILDSAQETRSFSTAAR